MKTLSTVAAMQAVAREQRAAGHRVGFVPTMGFLHEGHLSLMQLAREHADVVVASVFVNPTQFGPNEDLDQYPRNMARDLELCASSGVDYLFCPSAEEVYTPDCSVYVDEDVLSTGLCGASRSGHFRGVLTVVAKLFNMVMPDVAVFGQKDAQQAALIQRMVRDLNFPIEIVVSPIVREPDGLAMSSRNTYLSVDERAQALWLHRVLKQAALQASEGADGSAVLLSDMRALLAHEAPSLDVEYIEIVDAVSLVPVESAVSGVLIAIAAKVGKTRLIDNVIL
ncbi:MAG: pantoate--beta-alanine ligase [Verrucomicrobia bacterium]|jgi:pantoate--beta-alanine ligase|nr:pantoate--beta-alanine ligase [Verrucomicrobiota bacterium]